MKRNLNFRQNSFKDIIYSCHRRRFSIINKTIKLYFRFMVLSKPRFIALSSFASIFTLLLLLRCSWTNKYNFVDVSWFLISFLLLQLLQYQSNFTLALRYTSRSRRRKADRFHWVKSNTLKNLQRLDISRLIGQKTASLNVSENFNFSRRLKVFDRKA